jgi:hypothetical protein
MRDLIRFEGKVDRSGGPGACHEWQGSRTKRGYGKFANGPHGSGWRAAHRAAWEFKHGPIPEGAHVLHHCDNPPCVNPGHLFLGDNEANVADMVQKRRHRPQGRMPIRIGERQRRRAIETGGPWAERTHCVNGHEFTPENTRIRNARGHRTCRECERKAQRDYRARKNAWSCA